jgi:alanine racemase
VSLDALSENIRAMRAAVAPAALMGVVKANAYGHGLIAVAREMIAAGAAWLGVYAVEEGLVLRSAGIEAPILVFGPFTRGEAPAFVEANLTPTVTRVDAAEMLAGAHTGPPLSVHVKVDTGLTRAGAIPEDVLPLVSRIGEIPTLRFGGIYTHFASADEADKTPSRAQLSVFRAVLDGLRSAAIEIPLTHAANSAATLELPEAHFGLVRAGIASYGYYPSAEVRRDVPLRPVLQLLSAVTRVRSVPVGTGVGYGHEFRARRPSTIALVPVGYGDGLPRSLGNGRGRVLVHGVPAPIVGRVSMDQVTLDVTDLPDVQVGDEAVLIGEQVWSAQTADDVGDQAGTISYDILTGLLPRVPRIYVRGDEIVGVASLTRGTGVASPSAVP